MPGIIPQFKKKVKYVQRIEPTNPQMGDSWLDNETNSLKIYTGVSWSTIWGVQDALPYGFSMGGHEVAAPIDIVDRFQFPFDSGNAVAVGTITSARYDGGNTCNSSTHGFFLGGYTTNRISTMDRLDFPFHPVSAAVARGVLTQEKNAMGSCNSSNYGYCFGGYDKAAAAATNRMERFDFPFDSGDAYARGNLTSTTHEPGGLNSSSYGYVLGANHSVTNQYQEIQRFQFPFDSGNAASVGTFDVPITSSAGYNSESDGYVANIKASGSASNSVYKLPFEWSSGTATVYTTLTATKENGAACNSTVHGYVMGGRSPSPIITMERMEFAGDTSVVLRGDLSGSRWGNVGLDGTDFVGLFV